MAKEVHGYIKTLLVIAAVVFAGGGYAMKINGNTSAIADGVKADNAILIKVDKVKDDVHRIELDAKDITALAASAAESSRRSVEMFEEIQRTLVPMQISLGKMEAKVETLIKD